MGNSSINTKARERRLSIRLPRNHGNIMEWKHSNPYTERYVLLGWWQWQEGTCCGNLAPCVQLLGNCRLFGNITGRIGLTDRTNLFMMRNEVRLFEFSLGFYFCIFICLITFSKLQIAELGNNCLWWMGKGVEVECSLIPPPPSSA